jgi:CO/xanthine dehydrogenase FAD-binding subunit
VSLADLPRYQMESPGSLAELCQLVAAKHDQPGGVELLAGGTDLMVQISQGALQPETLPLIVDVSRLTELRGIDWDGTRLRIGAAVSYLEIQRHADVQKYAPLLERMTYDVGGPTIQARGTLGGNLATASPAADGVAAIAAFDAVVEVRSARGSRRIPIGELQTGYKQSTRSPDEVIVAIELEPPQLGAPWCWRKVGTRMAQAISKVALAAVAELDGPRVKRAGLALASVAPVTALLPTVRELLQTTPIDGVDAAALDRAVDTDISPIDDIRSTASYRAHCARAVVRDFARQLGADV